MLTMARALLFLVLSVAVSALPPALPVSPLKGLEPRANACDAVKNVVNILRLDREAAPFCSSVLHIMPSTLLRTVTSTLPPAVVTRTVVGTNTVSVTNIASSTSVQLVTQTSTVSATEVASTTRTIIITNNVAATTTVVKSQTSTRTVQVTTTALSTTTAFPVAKRAAPSLSALKGIASSLVSQGCSCLSLPTSTVTSTTTLAGAVQTSTTVESSTAVVTTTISARSTMTVQSTVDVTVTNTVTSTSEATTSETVIATTGTQEVDVTSTTTVDQTVTTTQSSVVTVTASPTCGVNLAVNGDFPQPQYAPFVLSSTGNAAPQFNAGCGIDPYCPLFIVNSGGGSATLTQTIATFPGQTYTLSFYYNNFGASTGSSLACSVDVAGSSPVSANLVTVTGSRFVLATGTFKATGTSTVLTCKGSTSSNMASNIQAIHVMC